PRPTFLTLPLEIRHEIYRHLLVLPRSSLAGYLPRIHPSILYTCRQTNIESTAVLYTNIFVADPHYLTGLPKLRPWYPPLKTTHGHKITRWYLPVRLDCPSHSRSVFASDFAGAQELVVDLWQEAKYSYLCGPGTSGMQGLEGGVRGVRKVEIWGVPLGWEGYVTWLKRMMTATRTDGDNDGIGEVYVCRDEKEKIRLGIDKAGWVTEDGIWCGTSMGNLRKTLTTAMNGNR
ncbi:hypothetical protein QBC39DRAFT_407745, partial [Podospora conica]